MPSSFGRVAAKRPAKFTAARAAGSSRSTSWIQKVRSQSSRIAGLFTERGTGPIRWRTRIVWRWPMLQVVYTRFPISSDAPPRPAGEHAGAQTRQEWGKHGV